MRLRNVTPKSLFGRMLAIILVPIILVQVISVSIFYERHWDWVSRHMSKNLAKDLGLFIDELGNPYSKILLDSDGTLAIEWGAYGVPETFLIYDKKKRH